MAAGWPELDLFHFWRSLLTLVSTVYVTVRTINFVINIRRILGRGDRLTRLGVNYTLAVLLRTRVRAFAGELFQILLLTAVLIGLISLHWI